MQECYSGVAISESRILILTNIHRQVITVKEEEEEEKRRKKSIDFLLLF